MIDLKDRKKRLAALVMLFCILGIVVLWRLKNEWREQWAMVQQFADPEAVEQVLNFETQLVVEKNGWVEVFEWIKVRVLGQQIKRGFCRTLPLQLREGDKPARTLQIRLLSAMREDSKLAAQAAPNGEMTEICLGDPNSEEPLPHGDYTYFLHYVIEDLIEGTEAHDRMYWEITGIWPIPIREGNASIILPPLTEAVSVQSQSRLEPKLLVKKGDTAQAPAPPVEISGTIKAHPDRKETNYYSFIFPRTVEPGEGIWTSLTWPPGMVERKGKSVVVGDGTATPSPSPSN